MPRKALVAFISALVLTGVLIALVVALGWSDQTLLIVGGVCAFLFAAVAAPWVLARPRPAPPPGFSGQVTIIGSDPTFPFPSGITTRRGNGN